MKALLDQLRSSQAWQDLQVNLNQDSKQQQSQPDTIQVTAQNHSEQGDLYEPEVSSQISSLLSSLQPSPRFLPVPQAPIPDFDRRDSAPRISIDETPIISTNYEPPEAIPVSQQTRKSVRNLTYTQSLPVLGRLASEPRFLDRIEKV